MHACEPLQKKKRTSTRYVFAVFPGVPHTYYSDCLTKEEFCSFPERTEFKAILPPNTIFLTWAHIFSSSTALFNQRSLPTPFIRGRPSFFQLGVPLAAAIPVQL